MISVEILADSLHPDGIHRLTTMRLTYPRFIHSEFMTHRLFSRNAASSRAIPSKRMRANIRRNPAMPKSFGANKPGMQQGEDLSPLRQRLGALLWLGLMHLALLTSWFLEKLGCHKQIVNRVTEPWMHITVICTGNEVAYANLFKLRCHPAAEPTFQELANAMRVEYEDSIPVALPWGKWHLPLGDTLTSSVARCCRVSYDKALDQSTHNQDVDTLKKLMGDPMHASPFEHQAHAMPGNGKGGNLGPHWTQYRKTFANECARA